MHFLHFSSCIQAALASSLDLRCYLLILPKQNGAITLDLPDFQLHREWQVSEVIDCLQLNEGSLRLYKYLCDNKNKWSKIACIV